ncbi:MAG: transcription termination factor NusA [Candidatus Pacebacteria bacterium]|nr:transcription termination factor NusA [Candidatus Paceibacterota bacterium]
METSVLPPRLEILQVADIVAREKGIDRDEVIAAMELAIQKAGRSKYGAEHDIRGEIDRKTGEMRLKRFREVVELVENEVIQIDLATAKRLDPAIEVGGFIIDILPPIDFGRIAAQTAKQVIVQRVREAERERQYKEFKDRIGEIVNGQIKRVEYGNVTVDLDVGRTEAVLRRDEILPRETLRVGDRVRALIMDVRRELRGPQIFLSRSHPQFMAKLFAQEVPEIYDGIIEIRAIARDPGSRAKMAVVSKDSSIDPVGSCVGMRGSRVQAVIAELQGEKIDIIKWSENPGTFVADAMGPAEVTKVVLNESESSFDVVVAEDQLSLAIGRRGQNVRLASQLTGWQLNIMTEGDEAERRNTEFQTLQTLFTEALDVDDVIIHLLIAEGFTTVEDIALSAIDELAGIEGFDIDLATELQNRAKRFLEAREAALQGEIQKYAVSSDVLTLPHMTLEFAVKLGKTGVKSLDDLADLATDELREVVGESMITVTAANEMILAARAHWFNDGAATEPSQQV